MDNNSLSHTKWKCKYHIIFCSKYRRQVIYGKLRVEIGKILRQLCAYKGVEIIKTIEKYIQNQLNEDIAMDKKTVKEYVDPFSHEPTKKRNKATLVAK